MILNYSVSVNHIESILSIHNFDNFVRGVDQISYCVVLIYLNCYLLLISSVNNNIQNSWNLSVGNDLFNWLDLPLIVPLIDCIIDIVCVISFWSEIRRILVVLILGVGEPTVSPWTSLTLKTPVFKVIVVTWVTEIAVLKSTC